MRWNVNNIADNSYNFTTHEQLMLRVSRESGKCTNFHPWMFHKFPSVALWPSQTKDALLHAEIIHQKNSIVSGWVTTCIRWCHTRVSCRCWEREKKFLVLSKHAHSLIIHARITRCDSVKWYKTSDVDVKHSLLLNVKN